MHGSLIGANITDFRGLSKMVNVFGAIWSLLPGHDTLNPDVRSLHSHAAVRLGKLLFPLFALALDVPETFFDHKVVLDIS